jgi:hypothetical protein
MVKSRDEQTLGEKYLEILQGNQLKERGFLDIWNSQGSEDFPELSFKEMMSHVSEEQEGQMRDFMREYLDHKLTTRYEQSGQYSVLMDIAGQIEQSCIRLGIDKTKVPKPVIGSMFTGSLKAYTQVCRSAGKKSLFLMFHLWVL